jgi:spermidine synthase
LKKINDGAIIRVVITTGVSSVVTQLLTIREFLTQFQGNEIVIALILFNWLVLGGLGTRLAHVVAKRYCKPTANALAWLSLALSVCAILQILAIRQIRDVVFTHGSSVGFYPTLLFSFISIAPYCLLLGFVLPYSLFVLRSGAPDYSAARIYITDNIGDIGGGALFSFVLVYWVSPMAALFLAHLPLLVSIFLLFAPMRRNKATALMPVVLAALILAAGIGFEKKSLAPAEGRLAYYQETRYGRIEIHQDQEQFTLFKDGVPLFSSQNMSIAEETIHYPLSQLETTKNVLLISAEGGIMAELKKHPIHSIDYVELDPAVVAVQFHFNMIQYIEGLNIIHQDGRAFLSKSKKVYEAIIVNLPEPNTFQVNRFFTDGFFKLAKNRLAEGGVLSFSMQGFDNFLTEPQRQKLSSLYNTAAIHFGNVLLLPGQKVFFLCSDSQLNTDIPRLLDKKGVSTAYIGGFFYGNLSPERIDRLNTLMDPATPRNFDNSPYLMRLMFSQWFAKFQTSPVAFFAVIAILSSIYLIRVSNEEYVLFSTGCLTMGSEILVIFAFQIYFGYIYLQIGIIITVFLAGLLPGAWLGNRMRRRGRQILALTDLFLIASLALFILAITNLADRLPVAFYLAFGFVVSLVCGFQFPVVLTLKGSNNTAATRAFSADLIGAACGTLLTSVVLIPYVGILWAAGALIGIKLVSLILIGTSSNRN